MAVEIEYADGTKEIVTRPLGGGPSVRILLAQFNVDDASSTEPPGLDAYKPYPSKKLGCRRSLTGILTPHTSDPKFFICVAMGILGNSTDGATFLHDDVRQKPDGAIEVVIFEATNDPILGRVNKELGPAKIRPV